jgi:hypothetical protein
VQANVCGNEGEHALDIGSAGVTLVGQHTIGEKLFGNIREMAGRPGVEAVGQRTLEPELLRHAGLKSIG